MKAGHIVNLLEPFRLACDANSLVPEYRLMQVNPDLIFCKTAKATVQCGVSFDLPEPFAVEVKPILTIANSLPEQAEMEFELQGNMLAWACGKAHGRLAVKPPFQMRGVPEIKLPNTSFESSQTLSALCELGAIACSNSALATVGLYGMVLQPDGADLWALSSDNDAIAAARMRLPPAAKIEAPSTIQPTEAPLLSFLAARKNARVAFTEKAILFEDRDYRTSVNLVQPLKHDLLKTALRFVGSTKSTHDINKERVQAFVKRAAMLAEARIKAEVVIHVEGEQLTLEFNEQLAQSQEVYPITEGFRVDEPMSVTVDAIKLAKALQNCDQMVFDYMTQHMIVFRAKSSNFHYIISGKRGQ
jgi:septum formation topological specificity factor MinE